MVRWLFLFLTFGARINSWGQSVPVLLPFEQRAYCSVEPVVPVGLDSTGQQIALDSIKNLLVGKWVLVQTEAEGYTFPRHPYRLIEMTLDKSGRGAIQEYGKKVASFHLSVVIRWQYCRFEISDEGRNYFNFLASANHKQDTIYQNGLRVCEKALVMYGFTSTGPLFIFKRQKG